MPAQHAAYLSQLIDRLQNDERFEALLGAGSMLHGGLDEHSDLDCILVAAELHHAAVMASRAAFAASLPGFLAAFTGEHVGEPRLLICLYGPPLLHVDLKFIRRTDLDQGVERPSVLWARQPEVIAAQLGGSKIAWPNRSAQWFEDRIWIWLHYAATKLQRGELLDAIGMLAYIREQVLGPMLHRRANRPQRGVRRMELLDAAATASLQMTCAAPTVESVASSLRSAIDLYLGLRDDWPPVSTPRMPALLNALIDCAN